MTEEEIGKIAYKNANNINGIDTQSYIDGFIDGYAQGQKDFDTDVTKLLNSYGIKFIDTNSIGGLIALHQLMLELEKDKDLLMTRNLDLVNQIEKMRCCGNCIQPDSVCHVCKNKDKWELAE